MPNPAGNVIRLRFDAALGETQFEIYNEAGIMVKREKGWVFENTEKQIDITYLLQGAFFVRIKSGNTVIDKPFIKQ